jgi:hypothetical protein
VITFDEATMWLWNLGRVDDALWLIEEVALGREEEDHEETPPLAILGWTLPAFFQAASQHQGAGSVDAEPGHCAAEVRLPAPAGRGGPP